VNESSDGRCFASLRCDSAGPRPTRVPDCPRTPRGSFSNEPYAGRCSDSGGVGSFSDEPYVGAVFGGRGVFADSGRVWVLGRCTLGIGRHLSSGDVWVVFQTTPTLGGASEFSPGQRPFKLPTIGRVIVAFVPAPGSLSRLSSPPWRETMDRTMESPSPAPPDSRDRALSTR
jgi:hypothetical protein